MTLHLCRDDSNLTSGLPSYVWRGSQLLIATLETEVGVERRGVIPSELSTRIKRKLL